MIKIERLIKEDIPQVVLLEEQFLGETLGTEMFENEINNESICFLTAKDNQKVLGYIGAYVVAGDLEILNFDCLLQHFLIVQFVLLYYFYFF